MVENDGWAMFSDSQWSNKTGRVVIRDDKGIDHIMDGAGNSSYLGEHMWIDQRSEPEAIGRRLQDDSDERLIAVSSAKGDSDSISFYKYIKTDSGEYKKFDFAIDAI